MTNDNEPKPLTPEEVSMLKKQDLPYSDRAYIATIEQAWRERDEARKSDTARGEYIRNQNKYMAKLEQERDRLKSDLAESVRDRSALKEANWKAVGLRTDDLTKIRDLEQERDKAVEKLTHEMLNHETTKKQVEVLREGLEETKRVLNNVGYETGGIDQTLARAKEMENTMTTNNDNKKQEIESLKAALADLQRRHDILLEKNKILRKFYDEPPKNAETNEE